MRGGSATVVMDAGTATLFLDGREFFRVKGPVRCFSDENGESLRMVSVDEGVLEATRPGNPTQTWIVQENQTIVPKQENVPVCH